MPNVFPAYALAYKKEYLLIRGIDKYFKGQMNQKIDIFSFVALRSPNTKKNHRKCDLG